jgi:hypothetical protein
MRRNKWKAGMAVGSLALMAVGTLASSASGASSSKHFSFFEKNASFLYTPPGSTTQGPPNGPPQPGSQIEFTDLNYAGTNKHHASKWSATDHFACVFSATGVPTCNGEIAIGGSMLIVRGTGGQGTFSVPVVSGTGAFMGYTGVLKIADIGTTSNANIEVTVSK